MTTRLVVPGLRLLSNSNTREHFMGRHQRLKLQQQRVGYAAMGPLRDFREGLAEGRIAAIRVTLTRVGPKRLDRDNAWSSMKAPIDAIAKCLGVDDADRRIEWQVEQEAGAYALGIEVRAT